MSKEQIKAKFMDGDWVFGLGEHDGCSQVFTGNSGDMQPFSYLDDYNPENYRLATKKEVAEVLFDNLDEANKKSLFDQSAYMLYGTIIKQPDGNYISSELNNDMLYVHTIKLFRFIVEFNKLTQ